MLNLFYQEPDPDRYIAFDRYPRRLVRRLLRGRPMPGGQMRMFLNLRAGLDHLKIDYRVNDYHHARRHPVEPVCIVGKPHVLNLRAWENPIVFGAAVFSHPVDDLELLRRLPVTKILVPGEWMRRMFEPYYGSRVVAWPVGIDTELWRPASALDKSLDVLLYDKVRWKHGDYEMSLIEPIKRELARCNVSVASIRYGCYVEADYYEILKRARAMVFLCEHETQGIAYQQALSCGVPVFAWDRGGPWQDPSYYPERVRFGPVSSVPYWDQRCGMKFATLEEFYSDFQRFWFSVLSSAFNPRGYILENLTLESCARRYMDLVYAR